MIVRSPALALVGSDGGDFEGIQREACIAIGEIDERLPPRFGEGEAFVAEAALRIGERGGDDRADVVVREGMEHEDAGAREQGGVHLEGGVLGRRADEDDRAVLDIGQDRVLLALVEAVNLVDEEQGAHGVGAPPLLRLADDAAEVGHARRDGAEGREVRA